jgi:hypothetical protein
MNAGTSAYTENLLNFIGTVSIDEKNFSTQSFFDYYVIVTSYTNLKYNCNKYFDNFMNKLNYVTRNLIEIYVITHPKSKIITNELRSV